MTHTVVVTLQDINAGERDNPQACPIALALKRAYPHRHVVVGWQIQVEDVKFQPSFDMCHFIKAFDSNDEVAPCTLTMREYDSDEYEDVEQ